MRTQFLQNLIFNYYFSVNIDLLKKFKISSQIYFSIAVCKVSSLKKHKIIITTGIIKTWIEKKNK